MGGSGGTRDRIRRGLRAAPLFAVPAAAVLWWSFLGGAIWSLYDGGDLLRLSPLTVGGALTALAAMVVAARAADEAGRRRRACWSGVVVGAPLAPLAAFALLYAAAIGWGLLWILAVLTGAAVTAAVAVWAGARAAARGCGVLHGAA